MNHCHENHHQCKQAFNQLNQQLAKEQQNIITFTEAWANMQNPETQQIINQLLHDLKHSLKENQ